MQSSEEMQGAGFPLSLLLRCLWMRRFLLLRLLLGIKRFYSALNPRIAAPLLRTHNLQRIHESEFRFENHNA